MTIPPHRMGDTPIPSSAFDSASAGPIPYYTDIPPEQSLRPEITAATGYQQALDTGKVGHQEAAFRELADAVLHTAGPVAVGPLQNYDQLLAGMAQEAKGCLQQPPCSGMDDDCSPEEKISVVELDWPGGCVDPLVNFLSETYYQGAAMVWRAGLPPIEGGTARANAVIARANQIVDDITVDHLAGAEAAIRRRIGRSADDHFSARELTVLSEAAEAEGALFMAALAYQRAEEAKKVERQRQHVSFQDQRVQIERAYQEWGYRAVPELAAYQEAHGNELALVDHLQAARHVDAELEMLQRALSGEGEEARLAQARWQMERLQREVEQILIRPDPQSLKDIESLGGVDAVADLIDTQDDPEALRAWVRETLRSRAIEFAAGEEPDAEVTSYVEHLATLDDRELINELGLWREDLTQGVAQLQEDLQAHRGQQQSLERRVAQLLNEERQLADQYIQALLGSRETPATMETLVDAALVEASQWALLTLRRDNGVEPFLSDRLSAEDHVQYAETLASGGHPEAAAAQFMGASQEAATEAMALYYHVQALEVDPTSGGNFLTRAYALGEIAKQVEAIRLAAEWEGREGADTDADAIPIDIHTPPARPGGSLEQVAVLQAELLKAHYLDALHAQQDEKRLLVLEDTIAERLRARTGEASLPEISIFSETVQLVLHRYVAPHGAIFRLFAQGDPAWAQRLHADVDATPLAMDRADEGGFLSYDWWFDVTQEWVNEQRHKQTSTKQAEAAYVHCGNLIAQYAEMIQPHQSADHEDLLTGYLAALRAELGYQGKAYGFGLPIDGLEQLAFLQREYPTTATITGFLRAVKRAYPQFVIGGRPKTRFYGEHYAPADQTHAMLVLKDVIQDSAGGTSTASGVGAGIAGCVLTGPLCILGGALAGGATSPLAFDLAASGMAYGTRQYAQSLATGFTPVDAGLVPALKEEYAGTIKAQVLPGLFEGMLGAMIPTGGRLLFFGLGERATVAAGTGSGVVVAGSAGAVEREAAGGIVGLILRGGAAARRLANLGLRGSASAALAGSRRMLSHAVGTGRALLERPGATLVNGYRTAKQSALGKFIFGKTNGRRPLPANSPVRRSIWARVKHYCRWDRTDPVSGELIYAHPETGAEYIWNSQSHGYVRLAKPVPVENPRALWRVADAEEGAPIVYTNPLGQRATLDAGRSLLVDAESGEFLPVRHALPTGPATTTSGELLYTDPLKGTRYVYMAKPEGFVPMSEGVALNDAEVGALRLASIDDGMGLWGSFRTRVANAYDAGMTTAENVSFPVFVAGTLLPRGDKGPLETANLEGLALMFGFTRLGHEFLGVNRSGQRLVFWMDRGADLYLQVASGTSTEDLDYMTAALQYGSGNLLGQVRGNWLIRDLASQSRSRIGRIFSWGRATGQWGTHPDAFRYLSSVQVSVNRVTSLATSSGAGLREEAVKSAKLYFRNPGRAGRFMNRLLKRIGMASETRRILGDEKVLMEKLLQQSNYTGELRMRPDGQLVRRNFGRTVTKRNGVEIGVRLSEAEQRTFARMFVKEEQGGSFASLFGHGQPELIVNLKPILNARGVAAFNVLHEMVIGPINEGARYALLMGANFANTAEWTFHRAYTTSLIGNIWKCAFAWDTKAAAWPRPVLRNGVDPYMTRHLPLWEGRDLFVPRYGRDLREVQTIEDFVDMHAGPGPFDPGGFSRYTLAKEFGGEEDPSYAQRGKAHLYLAQLLLDHPVNGKAVSYKHRLSPADVKREEALFDQLFTAVEQEWRGGQALDLNGAPIDYKSPDLQQHALVFALVADYVHARDPSKMGRLLERHKDLIEMARLASNVAPNEPLSDETLIKGIDRIGEGAIRLQYHGQ